MTKIYSWNVNGIRAVLKKGALQAFMTEHRPDVLCLQETKASPEQVAEDFDGYHACWGVAAKKGYAGTAILARKRPRQVFEGLPEDLIAKYGLADDGYGDPSGEGRVVTAEFGRLYVVSVYTPNAKGDLTRLDLRHSQWDPAFLEFCQRLDALKPVVFCGDFNVAHTEDDLARPKANVGKHGFTVEEREGFQRYLDAGFVDSFRLFHEGNGHYTWWTLRSGARERNVGWRIDYVMVSAALAKKVKAARIHADVMGSDHCPVSIDLGVAL